MAPLSLSLRRAYRLMRARFGHQQWWPGETPFEVCVGAILVQNTSWTNVERAIANLKVAGALEPNQLFALPERELACLIRPAGYFNVKAQRLRAFLRVLVEECDGDLNRLFAGPLSEVRGRLLAIHGIGPETADSLLLYVGGHSSFVIDAYTKRIFTRHGWRGEQRKVKAGGAYDYDALKSLCESALNQKHGAARLDYWQDYHAQLVMVGKLYCRPALALCDGCPLQPMLPAKRVGVVPGGRIPVDGRRCPALNQRMRNFVSLACILVFVAALSGCARHYTITTSGGRQITTKGKPKYDEENGVYRYTDIQGAARSVPAGSVSEIAPGMGTKSGTTFNLKSSR